MRFPKKGIKSSLTEMQAEMKKQNEKSYADALKMPTATVRWSIPPSNSNGIIITSTQPNRSSSQLEKSIKEKLNLTQAKAGVTKMKHISNDRVFLGTQSSADSQKLEKIITEKLGSEFKVTQPKPIIPKLIISNLEKEYNEEDLWEEIRSTNPGFNEPDTIKVVHKMNHKVNEGGKKKWSLIIQAPPIEHLTNW